MQKIIYASRATQPFTGAELEQLLEVSRRNNEAVDVTGLLIYFGGSFLQVLEGEADAIDELYDRIRADERHGDLRLLMRQPTAARAFDGWSMGFEHPDEDELVERLPGFTPATTYPLVSAELISNGEVAETLLQLYSRNG